MFTYFLFILVQTYIYKQFCPFFCIVTFIMFLYFFEIVQYVQVNYLADVLGIAHSIIYSKTLFFTAGSLCWKEFWIILELI